MTKTGGCFEKQGCIYKLTNKVNGKYYFGKTVDFKRRIHGHKHSAKKGKTYLARSIRKHGWENFTTEILIDEVPEEDLNGLEKSYIEIFDAMNPNSGYNLTRGGEGMCGWVPSKEWCRKKSEERKKHNAIGKGTISKENGKWKVYSTENDKIYVGLYNSKTKAEKALSTFNVSGERMESDTHELQNGCVTFDKKAKKWNTSFTWTENGVQKKKFVGAYNSKEKAQKALKTYVNSGTRLLSDTRPKREAGKGTIHFRCGKYRAVVGKSRKKVYVGTFKTKIEAENAIKKYLESGDRPDFKRSIEKGHIGNQKSGRFRARFKQTNIGTFNTREEARSAIDEYVKQNA